MQMSALHRDRLTCGSLGVRWQNASIDCQPLLAKIFHFTEIRICRICRLVLAHKRGGRTSSRTRAGFAMDAGGAKAGPVRAGRDEPREHGTPCKDGRRSCPAEPIGEAGRPAYGETVWSWPSLLRSSLGEGVSASTGAGSVHFAEVREARRNSAPGRARHRPSNHCAGKAWSRLPCVSPVHCACSIFAWGFYGCQPAPGLPCALSFRRG